MPGWAVPTVGESVNRFASVVKRGQTWALGLAGTPALQGSWQRRGPLASHEVLSIEGGHLLAFRLRLVWIGLLD